MPINFTSKQQKVIDLHNKNILVSAAAGSGKTAVLVERIIKMVCDESNPVDIDRLLIVTFTNAAASEMRERIAAGIARKLQENPSSDHIQRQSALLHNAQITTIDSFSLFIIRNHFNEIGLDPAFRVADEGEIRLLEQDVLSELLEEKFAQKNQAFEDCVEFFCPGGKEGVLERHILNLSRYASAFPWPGEWLTKRKEDYSAASGEEIFESDYGRYFLEHVKRLIGGCVCKLEAARKICDEPDGPYMYGELIERELEMLTSLLEVDDFNGYQSKLSGIDFARLPGKKDTTISPAKRETAKKYRNDVKDRIKKIEEDFFGTPMQLWISQGMECRLYVNELIDLVLEFNERMLSKKRERRIIDFSDMEHYALDILLKRDEEKKEVEPTQVALEYRQYFKEILIDEYQDSNLVQEYLLKAVSGEDDGRFNRFMVGDVKQSIYKFRLARPELFLEKYTTYEDEGDRTRIDLSQNFRSRAEVINGVNQIFEKIMDKSTGGIEYDDRAALYAGAQYPGNEGCECELLLVEKDIEDDVLNLNSRQLEALSVAERIKRLRSEFKVTDKLSRELRSVKYSDIVILLRTTSGWDDVFKKVLEEQGIPAYITSKTGYFSACEVQDILQFLRVIDNPRQDIPLFGTMRSVFGGFSDEEIAGIRGENKGGALYDAVLKTVENSEDAGFADKCAAFLEKIEMYRDLAVYCPIRELLQHIVDDSGYLDYVTALPAGSKRRANVEMLFTKASDFEKTSYFGLFHFVRYMEQLEKYDVDYGEADMLDENADVVRIMSIHKSKGLEFPITFVSGLSKHFNMQDVNQSLIVDMSLGLACDYVNLNTRVKNKTLRGVVLAEKMKEDNLAEELRVLYVAMTRAKEKLIMTASVKNAYEALEMAGQNVNDKLLYIDFIEAGSYLDFIMPVAAGTDFKITCVDLPEIAGEELSEQFEMLKKRQGLSAARDLADEKALDKLEKSFSFVYPYESMEKLYTKTTVSELKIAAMADKDEAAYHSFEEKEINPYIPQFKRGTEKVSGAVRGNAFHRVMELIDFEQICGAQFDAFPKDYNEYADCLDAGKLESTLKNFLLKEVERLRLSREYFDAVNIRKIVNFLKGGLAYRMWRAQRTNELYKEQPFVLGIDAKRLIGDIIGGEKVLIQGIIDAFFIEDNEVVLLDYKTDVIGSMSELKNRYETQLDYYEEALTKLTGCRVKERLLYSFYLEETA